VKDRLIYSLFYSVLEIHMYWEVITHLLVYIFLRSVLCVNTVLTLEVIGIFQFFHMYGSWKLFWISKLILILLNIVACQFSLLILNKRKLNMWRTVTSQMTAISSLYSVIILYDCSHQSLHSRSLRVRPFTTLIPCFLSEALKFANSRVEFLWLNAEYSCYMMRVNLDKSSLISLF